MVVYAPETGHCPQGRLAGVRADGDDLQADEITRSLPPWQPWRHRGVGA
jgi:hypothetical protein